MATRLLMQGYRKPKLVSTLRKLYDRHHDLVEPFKTDLRLVAPIKWWPVSVTGPDNIPN